MKFILQSIICLVIFSAYSEDKKENRPKTEKRQAKSKKVSEKEKQEILKYGSNYYGSFCAFCHAFNGKGILRLKPDTYMAPNLAGSKRVMGDPDNLIRILLNGLSGPVNGKSYLPIEMKAPKSFDSKQIAAILSYIRNSWGNEASIISVQDVERMKKEVQDRKKPWTAEELDALLKK